MPHVLMSFLGIVFSWYVPYYSATLAQKLRLRNFILSEAPTKQALLFSKISLSELFVKKINLCSFEMSVKVEIDVPSFL